MARRKAGELHKWKKPTEGRRKDRFINPLTLREMILQAVGKWMEMAWGLQVFRLGGVPRFLGIVLAPEIDYPSLRYPNGGQYCTLSFPFRASRSFLLRQAMNVLRLEITERPHQKQKVQNTNEICSFPCARGLYVSTI